MVKFNGKSVSTSALWVSKHDRLSDFYTSSWQRGDSPIPMVVVRLLLSAFALSILTWSLVDAGSPHWLIYLTNWGLLVVMTTMLSSLAVSSAFLSKKELETTALPWYVSLYWVVFNITVTLSVMITALYWILLYNPANREQMGTRAFLLDVFTHGMASCIVLAELLISRTPVRLAHIYQPLGLGLCYAAFTGIYYAAGGTDRKGNVFIYEVLNWQHPNRAGVVVAGSVAALVVLYLVLWSFAYFRNKLSMTYIRAKSVDLVLTPPHVIVDTKIV